MSKRYSTYRLTTMSGVHRGFVVVDEEARELCVPFHSDKQGKPELSSVNFAIVCALDGSFQGRIGFDEYGIGKTCQLMEF